MRSTQRVGALFGGGRRWRSGLFLLVGTALLVSATTGAALANGGDKTPPGQAKAARTATNPGKPAHPAHPATPATAANPVKSVPPATPGQPETPGQPTSPGKSAEAQHHVIICHRTGSATNPYVVINVSIRAWQHGHQTHPALDGRNDILLQDPAKPGEKLPVSACTTAAAPVVPTDTTVVVVDATTPGVQSAPGTATVGQPLVIVVHTAPDTAVSVTGAGIQHAGGVLGATKAISDKRGVARLKVVPTKQGLLSVKAGNRTVKRFGVLGAHTSGKSLTG